MDGKQKAGSGATIVVIIIIVALCFIYGGQQNKSGQGATTNASKTLTRISQLDPSQYASQEDYNVWAPSACSATSMTEVINAYGRAYQIKDILQVERSVGAISAQEGLLNSVDGIAATVKQFGFQVTSMQGATLDSLIDTANAGEPVIVSFPPQRWQGGHILVLRGGGGQNVWLADSSQYNFEHITRAKFLKYWAGWAVLVTPVGAAAPTGPHDKQYYTDLARQDAVDTGIDPQTFIRQINDESGFQTDIVSPRGAIGIAQFMPDTAKGLGFDPRDPEASLKGAAHLMASYLKNYNGDYEKALAAYNAGSGTVSKAIVRGGENWKQYIPQETIHYIDVVLH